MTIIKFIPFQRECGHNRQIRENLAAGNPGRPRFITDVKVMIDGEHRATLQDKVSKRGVELYDADLRPIHVEAWRANYGQHIGQPIEFKKDWEPTILQALEMGLIPTVARMAEMREEAAQAAQVAAAEEASKAAHRRAMDAGPALLAAMEGLLFALDQMKPMGLGQWTDPARKAVALAKGEAA